jgi:Domain of Unknown Function (DUF1080)
MRSLVGALALLPLFVISVSLLAQAPNTLTAQERSQGWQLLFDGKTLNGWHSQAPPQPRAGGGGGRAGGAAPAPAQPGALPAVNASPTPCVTKQSASTPAGSSHWEVVDGLLTACGEPAGYLNSDQSYRNFVLSLEFRTSETANSGVFVRSPKEAGGYEVQIWKQQPAGYNTGSIVGTAKTTRDYTFKADQWNHLQVTADGDHIVVVLNGETTLDIRDAKFPDGHIRLQYQQFPIAFRNVKLRPLP